MKIFFQILRGGATWKPSVTPIGSAAPSPLPGSYAPVTKTSLAANKQQVSNFGSGHNSAARPFVNVCVICFLESPIDLFRFNIQAADSTFAGSQYHEQAVQHTGRHVQRGIDCRVIVEPGGSSRRRRFGVNIDTHIERRSAKARAPQRNSFRRKKVARANQINIGIEPCAEQLLLSA